MQREIEVMRVLRRPPLGQLVVFSEDNRFESLATVQKPETRQRLLAAIGELIAFAGGYGELVKAGVAPPIAAPAPSRRSEQGPLNKDQAAFLQALEEKTDEIRNAPPPRRISLISSLRGGAETDTQPVDSPPVASRPVPIPGPTPAGAPVGIAGQIDAILQRILAADAALANRLVRLEQAPAGGLRINVDGTHYERPSDIPDHAVQLAIKRALQQWEQT